MKTAMATTLSGVVLFGGAASAKAAKDQAQVLLTEAEQAIKVATAGAGVAN